MEVDVLTSFELINNNSLGRQCWLRWIDPLDPLTSSPSLSPHPPTPLLSYLVCIAYSPTHPTLVICIVMLVNSLVMLQRHFGHLHFTTFEGIDVMLQLRGWAMAMMFNLSRRKGVESAMLATSLVEMDMLWLHTWCISKLEHTLLEVI